MVRSKPAPTNPRSLPQTYQRWLYEDYAHLWLAQSEATRAEYRTAGSRFHLTGFQYWMKIMLLTLPDIAGMWYLDHQSAGFCLDSGPNLNHAQVFGCINTPGVIDGAQSLDNVNDYLGLTDSPSLRITGDITIEAIIYIKGVRSATWEPHIVAKRNAVNTDYSFYMNSATLQLQFFDGVNFTRGTANLALNTWYHVCVRALSGIVSFFINGINDPVSVGGAANITPSPSNGAIGMYLTDIRYGLYGDIDHVIIYNRALDTHTITRHGERRHPQ